MSFDTAMGVSTTSDRLSSSWNSNGGGGGRSFTPAPPFGVSSSCGGGRTGGTKGAAFLTSTSSCSGCSSMCSLLLANSGGVCGGVGGTFPTVDRGATGIGAVGGGGAGPFSFLAATWNGGGLLLNISSIEWPLSSHSPASSHPLSSPLSSPRPVASGSSCHCCSSQKTAASAATPLATLRGSAWTLSRSPWIIYCPIVASRALKEISNKF